MMRLNRCQFVDLLCMTFLYPYIVLISEFIYTHTINGSTQVIFIPRMKIFSTTFRVQHTVKYYGNVTPPMLYYYVHRSLIFS